MTFPSVALTAADYTRLRQAHYSQRTYVAVCPNRVVFRAQITQTTFGASFASVTHAAPTIGTAADVLAGMTVLVSTTTNHRDAFWVGRVRRVPTATEMFINETSAAFTSGMWLTVIDDRRIWQRLQRVDRQTRQRFKDWDVLFQPLAPTISGLQSTYVLVTGGASATVTLSPQARAHVPGVTITGWAWLIGDGTLISGTLTSQTITVSFPPGHRWVRVTATDNGGRSTYLDVEVYVGDPMTASWSARNVRNVSVSVDETGANGSLEWLGTDGLDEGGRVTLFTVESSGAPIVSNIALVGYVRTAARNQQADADLGLRTITPYTVEGFGTFAANLNLPGLSALDDNAPNEWGEIDEPTPVRFTAYALLYHSTLANLCSVTFGTGDDAYVFRDLSAESASLVDALNQNYAQIGGGLSFAPSGEMRFRRRATMMPAAARNALLTVVTIDRQDMLETVTNTEAGERVGQLIAGFGAYNTSSGAVTVYQAKSPAEAALEAQEAAQLNSQILLANQTVAQNRSEAGQRAADALAELNERTTREIVLRDDWWWLVPSVDQWYQFSDVSGRWLCRSVTWSNDNETGRREVRATFLLEAIGGSSQTLVALIPQTQPLDNPVLPVYPDYPYFPPDASIHYPTTTPSGRIRQAITPGDIGLTQPRPPQTQPELPQPGCRTISFLMNNPNNTSSGFVLQSGETYTITVQGAGRISSDGMVLYNFAQSDGGWLSTNNTLGQLSARYTGGQGWIRGSDISNQDASSNVVIRLPLTGFTLTRLRMFMLGASGGTTSNSGAWFRWNNADQVQPLTNAGWLTTPNSIYISRNVSGGEVYNYVLPTPFNITTGGLVAGFTNDFNRVINILLGSWIDRIEVYGRNFPDSFGFNKRGDAFYRNIDDAPPLSWAGFGGLYINDAPALVSPPEPYNPNNRYTFTRQGLGAPINLRFAGAPAAQPVPIFVTICGAGA